MQVACQRTLSIEILKAIGYLNPPICKAFLVEELQSILLGILEFKSFLTKAGNVRF